MWGINIEPAYHCGLYVKCTFLDGPGDTHKFKRHAGVPLDMNIPGFIGGRLPAHLPFALMWHLEFVHRLQHVFNEEHSPLAVELKQAFDSAGYRFDPEEVVKKYVSQ